MAHAVKPAGPLSCGFTLLELLLVLALLGLLLSFSIWGGVQVRQDWLVRRAAEQLLDDLKAAQSAAERGGNLALDNGALVSQRVFLVFTPAQRRYAMYHWQDRDQDGVPSQAETSLDWEHTLPEGVSFGWLPGTDRKACSNTAGVPGAPVTYTAPDYAPCLEQPCVKFDRQGFSVIGPGTVYLTGYGRARAISGTRPGHFTSCSWDGARWR